MQKMLGESFDGLISSVTKFGVFVLLREFNIDGLIRLDDLGQERFEFDEQNLTLTAKRSGKSYKMGDIVKVTVSLVDIEQGQINFVLDKAAMAQMKPNATGVRTENSEKREMKYAFTKSKDKDGGRDKGSFGKNSRSAKKAEASKTLKNHKKDDRKPFSKNAGFVKSFENKFSKNTESKSDFFEKTEPAATSGTGAYTPKPRYASLTDYLDQKNKKGSNHEEKSESKPAFRSTENRKNSEKRSSSANDSGGVRKARPQKSGRKNKSR